MPELYAAPLEGVTTAVWRSAHRRIFGGVDRYYTPFLSPNANLSFQARELREIAAVEPDLVPQLLTNRSEYFLWAAQVLRDMGYRQVDFNLGCPSGTVVAKHKGAGLLTDPRELDEVLSDIFRADPGIAISAKTRIGRYDVGEWPALLAVYERHPLCQLTVHPRIQKEFYTGSAHRDVFLATLAAASLPLVYNGDVTSPADPALTWGCPVMLGRGLAADPALARRIRGGPPASRQELRAFHDAVYEGCAAYMGPAAVGRLRELWNYLILRFRDADRPLKAIRKAGDPAAYHAAANAILDGCPLTDT